jgi:pimeloyl-ACP methyl ester carboxylesterase
MRLIHGRVALDLHQLAQREGVPLLLLHALYGSSQDWGETPAAWPGPVYALDFCGHGRSQWLRGGGYCPELLLGDADVALAHVGRTVLVGIGLGAYIALLLSGARPDLVPAALLLPGAGLVGGGPLPDFERALPDFEIPGADGDGGYDPLARALDLFVRPVDYAESFARAARRLLLWEDGASRPPWWEGARRAPRAEAVRGEVRGALVRLLELASTTD